MFRVNEKIICHDLLAYALFCAIKQQEINQYSILTSCSFFSLSVAAVLFSSLPLSMIYCSMTCVTDSRIQRGAAAVSNPQHSTFVLPSVCVCIYVLEFLSTSDTQRECAKNTQKEMVFLFTKLLLRVNCDYANI